MALNRSATAVAAAAATVAAADKFHFYSQAFLFKIYLNVSLCH